MIVERPKAPTRQNLTKIRVRKVRRETTECEVVETGIIFTLPMTLLPVTAAEGDCLMLKVLDPVAEEENHTVFAQRLLEEIMS
jgi:hypothetical protein